MVFSFLKQIVSIYNAPCLGLASFDTLAHKKKPKLKKFRTLSYYAVAVLSLLLLFEDLEISPTGFMSQDFGQFDPVSFGLE